MQPRNDPGGTRRGQTSERRAERALRERIGNPPWLLAVRHPSAYEDSVGVDLACRTEGAGEINVQVKSSERHGKKFLGTLLNGRRGAVPIAVVVVRDGESNRELGERIVASVGALRDEILAEGRGLWSARKEREFAVRKALRFRTDDLDVAAAGEFMRLAEGLPDPWPLWLRSIGHGEYHGTPYPMGVVHLETDLGYPIRLLPSRCKERVKRVSLAVGPEPPKSLVTVPVLLPEVADLNWLEAVVCGKAGSKHQKLANYVMSLGRTPRQP